MFRKSQDGPKDMDSRSVTESYGAIAGHSGHGSREFFIGELQSSGSSSVSEQHVIHILRGLDVA